MCVCVLALTHTQLLHYTSSHMGNNEITKIILSEKEIRCIFMAGALCMLTAWRQGAEPTLPPRAFLSLSLLFLFFFSLFLARSFPLASLYTKTVKKHV